MNNSIIQLTDKYYESVMDLGEYAFNYKLTEQDREERKKVMKQQQVYGSFKEKHLAAKLHLLPMELYLGNDKIEFGGIAGVATWPEYRRQGHVDKLLRHSLTEMKQKSLSLSMLHPFSIGFYRKYGWELTQYKYTYSFSPSDLPKQNTQGCCVDVSFQDSRNLIRSLYEEMATRYSLMMKREDWWWNNRVISTDHRVILYINQNKVPTGYLIAKMDQQVLKVDEIVYRDGDACLGLLGWVGNHDSMTNQVEMIVQPKDEIAFYFNNPKVKLNKSAYFMTRIVDFESFIWKYPFFSTEKMNITIQLHDEIAEWNNGEWMVEIEDNRVKQVLFNSNKKSDAKISLDIQSLAALLFNSEDIQQLITFNRIKIEGDVEGFKRLLQPLQPALLDFF
ncbi:GNAT family N-acetyltransferase [Aquibacillus rhizosphaerae]|uniref:GNAT family N-acetyltransferase n=1 Tax=Aquibacillus rhizosphaerae TaxID=3051431 RepID=A0ABT7L5Z9_9BACI|nr:GNAT family N-acetyltransferase [Aquibacillus sp. LR5S19]MDL4841293.1 GNAT family N-acetyltransferase [Aquibacillus sp. LR5S19]